MLAVVMALICILLLITTCLVVQRKRRKRQRELKKVRTPGRALTVDHVELGNDMNHAVANADLPDMMNAVNSNSGYLSYSSPSLNSANSLEEAGTDGFIGDLRNASYQTSDDAVVTPRMGSGTDGNSDFDGNMDFKMRSRDSSLYQNHAEGHEGVQHVTGNETAGAVTASALVACPASATPAAGNDETTDNGVVAFAVNDIVRTTPNYAKMDSV